MPESARGYRDLDSAAAEKLSGLWVAAALGDAPSQPLTPLAWDLALEDADLLERALDRRGASLPRRSRRLVAVAGHAYHAFLPLVRASRELIPLQPWHLALAIACEARGEVERLFPARPRKISKRSLMLWVARLTRTLARLSARIVGHEQHASQHYRWLTEMDLGILPDDALATTLRECWSICRASRRLEIEATLDLLNAYAALCALCETARLGDPMPLAASALIPDPLGLPTATPTLSALAWASAARSGASDEMGQWQSFSAALHAHGPGERSLLAPHFGERPTQLAALFQRLKQAGDGAFETRISRVRRLRSEELQHALELCGALGGGLLKTLFALIGRFVSLRSRSHVVRSRTLGMLRTAVLDVDRRLKRLLHTRPSSVFFLRLKELLESTLRPDPALLERVRTRREAFDAAAALAPPRAVLGRQALPDRATRSLTGVGLGGERAIGAACVATNLDTALSLEPSGVLVLRSLDPGLGPALLSASAIVTDVGGLTDEGVLLARSLGIPLVIGTRDATAQLATGEKVTVDAREGRVWVS
ncbi:MAG TPA: PEP-utilizing enzyme [Polyangiaceae bacterium]|nr:PEP-utilizing enzyme [Polyangiaceae bacterium]